MWYFIFLVSGVYALLHFVWQSIISPSIRLEIRFRIFALRDELRRLKLEDQNLSSEAFRTVEDGLNSALQILYEIDIPILIHCDARANTDPQLKEHVQKRMAIIKDANSIELEKIVAHLRKNIERAALVNSGGWILYVLPPMLMVLCFKRLCSPIFSVIYMNRAEINKIFPESEKDMALA
jgi:hypothetical protein